MSFWSSASVIGWSGRLRSWLWVVVKPLTSSPAIPMTTWLGRKPAISSASWRATEQLSTTAAISATVPDCMWREALALAPDAADRAVPVVVDLEDERLGELGADVERRAGGQRRRRRRAARCRRQEGHRARTPSWRRGRRDRLERRPAAPSRRVPLPWAISGRPPPLPSMSAARRPGRGRRPTIAAPDEVVADRDEELRLVGVEAERDHARRRGRRGGPWRAPFSASIDSNGPAKATSRTPGATSSACAASSPGFGSAAATARAAAAASSRAARPGAPRSGPGAPRPTGAPAASARRVERRRRARRGTRRRRRR